MGEENDIVFNEKYIWQKSKAEINLQKHKISFETATIVFEDPIALEIFDEENSTIEETRYNIVGSVGGIVILFVVITERDDKIHIISARKANPKERELYYANAKNLQS